MNNGPHAKPMMGLALPLRLLSILVLGLLWWTLSALPVFAAEIVVDPTGMDAVDCGTELAPCRSIAYAVNNRAVSGDLVLVRAGTYTETITMQPGVIISGTGAATTFIDGEGLRGPMISAQSGVTTSAIFQGFTIRGGTAAEGGGLLISGTASPWLRDLVVADNRALRGGGLYIASTAAPRIENLVVQHNHASGTDSGYGGGGIYAVGDLTLTDTYIFSNTAAGSGGGLYQNLPDGWITLVRGGLEQNVAENTTVGHGGGAFINGSLSLTGTLVADNTASRVGGGMFVSAASVLTNPTFLRNTAGIWGGGFYQSLFTEYVQITGGRFEANRVIADSAYAGGIFASSAATISGTQVISNAAVVRGGGIYLARPSTLINVVVVDNSARSGGGVYYSFTSEAVTLLGGHFEGNRATSIQDGDGSGGALYARAGVVLTETLILNNSAARWGGGIYAGQRVRLYQPQFIGNRAAEHGGGLYQGDPGVVDRVDVIGGVFESNYVTATLSRGGGLWAQNMVVLTGTQFLSNTAGQYGGGIFAARNALLNDVTVMYNTAGQNGGGLYQSSLSGQARIIGGLFDSNVALAPNSWQGGGGVYSFGTVVLTGTQLTRNTSGGRGGGGLLAERGARIVNALFVDNTATDGAGIHLRGAADSQELIHLTIAHRAAGSGSAIYVYSGTVGITNTVITSHTVGLRRLGGSVSEDYNLYFGNGTALQGTIQSGGHSLFNLDPLFLDPGAEDYRIAGESAALDAGSFVSGVTADIDGNFRPVNPAQPNAPDIGCYENGDTIVRRFIADELTFGSVCARLAFTDTAELTAVTAALDHVYPPDMGNLRSLQRTYSFTPTGSGPVAATLTLCYTDDEIAAEGLDETTLRLYRYDGIEWHPYPSVVDPVNNTLTTGGVDSLGIWALAAADPTAVRLSALTARPTSRGVVIEWETAVEVETLGFNLYRIDEMGRNRVRLNEILIPGEAMGSVTGARYQWFDTTAELNVAYTYWLEDVSDRGQRTPHGPVPCRLPNAVFRLINLP